MKTMRSVVLLSSGLDSTYNLYKAHSEGEVVLALTFNYGQKAAVREIERAQVLTKRLGIAHRVVDVSFIKSFGGSSLLDENKKIPTATDVNIESLEHSFKTAEKVWVPNRNGILLNIAAGFAESLGAECIIPGFNKEEAATFPDNTDAFLKALSHSFTYSTANQLKAICYSTDLDKTEIVKESLKLEIPLEILWPCYHAYLSWCGECESCLRFKRALTQNSVNLDPLFLK